MDRVRIVGDERLDLPDLLNALAVDCWKEAGLIYNDELEFIFPEMTGDTTTEKIKNIAVGEESKFISHKTAATMYASEMHISTFDYDEEQAEIDAQANTTMDGAAAGLLPGGGHQHDTAGAGGAPPATPGIRGAAAGAIKDQLQA